MKLKLNILFLLTTVFSQVFAQSSYPELKSDSAVESLAVYKGGLVVVVPIKEYKLTNVVLESLISRVGELQEVDSVKTLRIDNLDSQIKTRDERIENLIKELAVAASNINDLKDEKDRIKKQRNRIAIVAGLYVLNSVRKIYLFMDSL